MRYGVLYVPPIMSAQERDFINIGDAVQTVAILYLYEQMGIPREDVLRININEISSYTGEYVVLPININLSANWLVNIFPLPPHIIPVFLGLSYFTAEKLPRILVDYFQCYSPIGCRDESTLNLMRENGIQAYLFGCITSILPQYAGQGSTQKNIFFVDVPYSFEKYAQKCLGKTGYESIKRVSHIYWDCKNAEPEYLENQTQNLLARYCLEASVVITSRLHCMSPCMAMGVPVIPVTDNISPRMGWIDHYLKIYTPQNYGEINWAGQVVSYEDQKSKLLDVAKKRVLVTVKKYAQIFELSYILETRERSEYGNYYKEVLKRLPAQRRQNLKYALWGSGQIGINVYQVISRMYPDSTLVTVIDSYCEGTFRGIEIQKPDVLFEMEDVYIFITTTSGEACARKFLKSLNKLENQDFLSMATSAG